MTPISVKYIIFKHTFMEDIANNIPDFALVKYVQIDTALDVFDNFIQASQMFIWNTRGPIDQEVLEKGRNRLAVCAKCTNQRDTWRQNTKEWFHFFEELEYNW